MNIRIEDGFEDILAKAQAGLGLSDAELAASSGVEEAIIVRLKEGDYDKKAASTVAAALQVDAKSLSELASGWCPEVTAPKGLYCFNTPFPVPGYEEMTVNAYMIVDAQSRQAIAFDTGGDVGDMLAFLEREKLSLAAILITHAHSDHVKDLLTLKNATGAPAYTPERERVAGAEPFEPGKLFEFGRLEVRTVETSGHSPGAVTYLVKGLEQPIAIVGDALFAGSAGGAANAWAKALDMVREHILALPGDTVLCPGHGPITTVLEELNHNPLFVQRT